jgi:hypothetical protein
MPIRDPNSEHSFDQFVNSIENHFNSVWNSISPHLPPLPDPPSIPSVSSNQMNLSVPDLSEVQSQLNSLANKVWNGLTLNGALLPGSNEAEKQKKVLIEWKYDSK